MSGKRHYCTAVRIFLLGLLVATPNLFAQNVSIGNGTVEVFDTDGDSAVLIDNGADYTAGGDGRTASLTLRASDGLPTLTYNAFLAQLIVGGDSHEGILLIKDDDFVTTIELDGQTGAVRLGGLGKDGDVIVFDNTAVETFRINGANGTATNDQNGNGLVKAWARVGSDGTVESCWRCSDANRSGAGIYTVSFNIDVSGRPRTATIDSHAGGPPSTGTVRLDNAGTSGIGVRTTDNSFTNADRPFTVVVY